jgi:hypothetical protein
MASEEVPTMLASLDYVRKQVGVLLEYAQQNLPKWELLNFNKEGVGNLYAEYRRVNSINEYLQSALADLELRRGAVVSWLEGQEVQLDKKVFEELQKNGPKWVGSGYAAEERKMFAVISAGGKHQLRVVRASLNVTDAAVAVLRNRIKSFSDFDFKARLMKDMLNFGHALQEL